jgi:hypothetical protein
VDPRVFAVLRESSDGTDRMWCLHNVSAEAVTLEPLVGLTHSQRLLPYAHGWFPAL